MFIKKNFTLKGLFQFGGGHLVWISLWVVLVTCFIEYLHYLGIFAFKVPWLPVSLIGTAVAFYVGFKNNSAYDRLWEARKIWGAIVNTSRMFGTNTLAYVGNQFRKEPMKELELKMIHKKMVYRHIAWLYTLRKQLLVPTEWEHIKQNKFVSAHAKKIMNLYGVGQVLDEVTEKELLTCMKEDELNKLLAYQNTATQIINQQSQTLKELREKDLIDDFRHMELQKLLNDFYTHQGQAERIKKFPLPRQYGSMSFIFIGFFIVLLPFGLVTEFHELGEWGAWLSMPFSVIVCWVFLMMELVGDYSENPFEGLGNDIPMLSICRTIEIDLKEMLGETDLPSPIESKNGVLM
ncbi:MAG: bestrophin family protein [Bacteroidia bacterium]